MFWGMEECSCRQQNVQNQMGPHVFVGPVLLTVFYWGQLDGFVTALFLCCTLVP